MSGESPAMPPSGIATLGVVALALLGLAAVGYERSMLKDLRALSEAKAAALAHSQETLSSLGHQLQAGARQIAALGGRRQAKAPAGSRRAGNESGPLPGEALDKAKEAGQQFLSTDPSIRQTIEQVARLEYQTLFGPFFRQQNLSSQQLEQLEHAVAETWIQSLVVTPQGGIYPAQGQPSPEVLTSILGADGYQQLQTYQRTLQAVSFSQQVATEAGYESAPLSPAQQDKIAEIIAGASESYQNGKNVNLGAVDWNSVLGQAQSAGLAPAQSDALERLIANQQYQAALGQAERAQTAAQ